MRTFNDLTRAFAVEDAAIRNWVSRGRFGVKLGANRVFDDTEAFALGLLAGVLHLGHPVSNEVIDGARAIATANPRPARWTIAETETGAVEIDVVAATTLISEKLKGTRA